MSHFRKEERLTHKSEDLSRVDVNTILGAFLYFFQLQIFLVVAKANPDKHEIMMGKKFFNDKISFQFL